MFTIVSITGDLKNIAANRPALTSEYKTHTKYFNTGMSYLNIRKSSKAIPKKKPPP